MQEKSFKSRREQAAATKQKIYASAEQLFLRHGFDAVNIDDIVKHAGVAKGSFYVHFESKNLLIATMINHYVWITDDEYRAYWESLPPDLPVRDAVLALAGKIADVITASIGCKNMGILYQTQLGESNRTHAMIDYNRALYQLFCDIIGKGLSTHEFRSPLSAYEIARHFVTAYRGLTFEWCVRDPDFDLKEQALRHFEILLHGLDAYGSPHST